MTLRTTLENAFSTVEALERVDGVDVEKVEFVDDDSYEVHVEDPDNNSDSIDPLGSGTIIKSQ